MMNRLVMLINKLTIILLKLQSLKLSILIREQQQSLLCQSAIMKVSIYGY